MSTILTFEERHSDSPFVERIWRSTSEHGGPFLSIAMSHWEMVVTHLHGRAMLTVRGPETRATLYRCPAEGEWIGIRFRLGTTLCELPAAGLVDDALNLPAAGSRSFWLSGSSWHYPDYENVELFVRRLVRDGLVMREPIVDAALHGRPNGLSPRTLQRRFLRTTGLRQGAIRQIERARYATTLLRDGLPILDVVDQAGYFDQPHLTRSLKHFIGQTPAQIMGGGESTQLSFLYKTALLH